MGFVVVKNRSGGCTSKTAVFGIGAEIMKVCSEPFLPNFCNTAKVCSHVRAKNFNNCWVFGRVSDNSTPNSSAGRLPAIRQLPRVSVSASIFVVILININFSCRDKMWPQSRHATSINFIFKHSHISASGTKQKQRIQK